MDRQKLKGKILASGFTQKEVAKKIGISTTALSRKLNDEENFFTISQMLSIMDLLNISKEEAKDIFLIK